MQSIANVMINIVQTRPPHQQHSDRIYHCVNKIICMLFVGLGRFGRRLIARLD
jgi:hypothetical protein